VVLSVNNIEITPARAPGGLGFNWATSDESYERVYNTIAGLKPGDLVTAKILRGGKVVTLTTTVEP